MQERIQSLIENGYSFSVTDYLSRGIEYYRNYLGPISLLIGAATIIPLLLTWVNMGGISSFINLLLITPFVQGAMAIFLKDARAGNDPHVETFSKATDVLPRMILFNLLYSLILIAVLLPTIIYLANSGLITMLASGLDDPAALAQVAASYFDSNIALLILLNMIPLLYFYIGYWYTPFFIVYHDMQPWEAMETSRKLVTKKWWQHFFLALLIGLLAFVLGLLSAIFAAMPVLLSVVQVAIGVAVGAIFYCAVFASYDDVVGFDEGGTEEDVLDHLIS